jgi:uncharacterized protein YndB with AHSA1/START domain
MPERQLSVDEATLVTDAQELEPVRKSLRVRADVAKAFRVFTEEMDSWWPRTHHIGSSQMKRVVVESRPGGAIYTDQEDGTVCPWGSVLTWEPPHLFVMAWQIRPDWTFEPDLSKCSEVEVRFTPADDGTTLVELEHRHIERHGAGWSKMHEQVNGVLELFGAKVDEA